MNAPELKLATVKEGLPYPKGATWDGKGVNFALFSAHATKVELCLFDSGGTKETARIELPEYRDEIWHGFVPDIGPGTFYGFRVHGPYKPDEGHRFNPNKLLLDPYARATIGELKWDPAVFGYKLESQDDSTFDERDSAPFMPKSVVVDPDFDWKREKVWKPVPWDRTIVYETHVRGYTKLHPKVPEKQRGSYVGLAHKDVVAYIKALGVTTVELLPVHTFVNDDFLLQKKLTNYWGYNSIGFFAPDPRYAADASKCLQEFKEMVARFHDAGLEVIIDVVYNHTAEGNERGPTLSFKGIDNAAYYRLMEDKRYYNDYTGTGNTLNANLPNVLRLMMDSLRYWILEMHVDGFRFDLASTLARELHEVDRLSAFFDIIHQDPTISQVKLIAEPWDVGEGGYQVGNFPVLWTAWNGKYRDTVRRFWRG